MKNITHWVEKRQEKNILIIVVIIFQIKYQS